MSATAPESDRKTRLAEERTETAHRRTLLAEERTYSAWVRTGLASAATGFAIAKLMTATGPEWLIRALGSVFILAGATMFGLGFWAYRSALRELEEVPDRGIPLWVLAALSLSLLAGSAVGLVLVISG